MPADAAPFRHPVRVEAIKPSGTDIVLSAGEAERIAIARALGLASLEKLEARYRLTRNGDRVRLEGAIAAEMHQICVVTLEPFATSARVPVVLDFAPPEEAQAAARAAERDIDGPLDIEVLLTDDDPPEPIEGGAIDLGEVTVEFLSLGLDPYPRKPGAQFDAPQAGSGLESPFAALARLKT